MIIVTILLLILHTKWFPFKAKSKAMLLLWSWSTRFEENQKFISLIVRCNTTDVFHSYFFTNKKTNTKNFHQSSIKKPVSWHNTDTHFCFFKMMEKITEQKTTEVQAINVLQTFGFSGRSRKLHTEKYFRNLIESNGNLIIFTILRLIWNNKRTLLVCCSKSISAW